MTTNDHEMSSIIFKFKPVILTLTRNLLLSQTIFFSEYQFNLIYTQNPMKKNLLLVFVMLLLLPAFGQKSKKDVVYLKTGAIIRGQLLTYDLATVKINSDGNLWVFQPSEVDSVSRALKAKPDAGPIKNYFFDSSMGVLVGNSGNAQKAPFSFMTSANFKVLDKLYVGAGLGAEFLDETYMPAFAQIQYKFRNTRFTPFVNLQFGYMVPLEDSNNQNYTNYYPPYSDYYPGGQSQASGKLKTDGGILINPSLGFQRFTSENFGWFFSFGYRYHQLNYSGDNKYKLEENYSRLSLKIGVIFN